MKIDDRLWQDKVKAIWGRPTREMHTYFYDKLEQQLKALRGKRSSSSFMFSPSKNSRYRNPTACGPI